MGSFPGVHVEEAPLRWGRVAAAPTAVTAFAGRTARGPTGVPVPVASAAEYDRRFGGLHALSEVSYAVRLFFANGGRQAVVVRVPARARRLALFPAAALDGVGPLNLLCLPGVTAAATLAAAAAYCADRRAFLVADAPPGLTTGASVAAAVDAGAVVAGDHAAVYHPWLDVADPLAGGRARRCPPCGAVAGVYARTDAARGVWKAPAGAEAALESAFAGGLAPAVALSDADQELLTPLGVNAIRAFPGRGVLVWGARTRAPAASEFRYVPVRRLALHVEASLAAGLAWAAFEPNAEPLWAAIRQHADGFLNALFRRGAFVGATPRDTYFVRCGADTTTAADLARGVVDLVVGFAPLKPAEFTVRTLRVVTAGAET